MVAVLVKASPAQRILEIGCGLGYSALWLAEGCRPQGIVDTIERDCGHAALAQQQIELAGLDRRIAVHEGEADLVLEELSGPYDFVYDDGWFMEEPAYLGRLVDLIRPGGLITMANWFPLQDAVLGGGEIDWTDLHGADWAESIDAYARKLASHPRLSLAYILQPWLGLAVKIS